MKKLIASLLFFASFTLAFSWGQKGHDVTAHIAERHLTDATRAAIDSIFDGRSIVYWCNWLDNASHTPEYAYTKTWHYKNIDEGEDFATAAINPNGNIELALYQIIADFKNGGLDKEQAVLNLRMLVHLMGDLHQPMHLGRLSDLGGNLCKIKYFGRDANLHGVWDTNIPESAHKWSYTEWADQIDRPALYDPDYVLAGTISDWARQTWIIAKDVYGSTPEGTNISYDYVAMFTPVVEQQFLYGGLRLAHILNGIFDPDYSK